MRVSSWQEMRNDHHSFEVNPFVGLISLTVGPIVVLTAVLAVVHALIQ